MKMSSEKFVIYFVFLIAGLSGRSTCAAAPKRPNTTVEEKFKELIRQPLVLVTTGVAVALIAHTWWTRRQQQTNFKQFVHEKGATPEALKDLAFRYRRESEDDLYQQFDHYYARRLRNAQYEKTIREEGFSMADAHRHAYEILTGLTGIRIEQGVSEERIRTVESAIADKCEDETLLPDDCSLCQVLLSFIRAPLARENYDAFLAGPQAVADLQINGWQRRIISTTRGSQFGTIKWRQSVQME